MRVRTMISALVVAGLMGMAGAPSASADFYAGEADNGPGTNKVMVTVSSSGDTLPNGQAIVELRCTAVAVSTVDIVLLTTIDKCYVKDVTGKQYDAVKPVSGPGAVATAFDFILPDGQYQICVHAVATTVFGLPLTSGATDTCGVSG